MKLKLPEGNVFSRVCMCVCLCPPVPAPTQRCLESYNFDLIIQGPPPPTTYSTWTSLYSAPTFRPQSPAIQRYPEKPSPIFLCRWQPCPYQIWNRFCWCNVKFLCINLHLCNRSIYPLPIVAGDVAMEIHTIMEGLDDWNSTVGHSSQTPNVCTLICY